MGRLGFGTDRFRSGGGGNGGPQSPALATIAPSVTWDGTAGSGFTAIPTDPTRITAKPACRLIVLPNEAYTDNYLVGVYAGANDNGSLLSAMGLDKVTFHFEGTSVDVTEPTLQSVIDANGTTRSYFGWWAQLDHDGRNGIGNLYVEAIASDATMQSRVIGPYAFLPKASLYDFDITVEPSQPTLAGARYTSIGAATNYLRTQTFDNARITLAEPGIYDPNGGFGLNLGEDKGRVVIEAAVPVTIRSAAPAAGNYWMRPKCEPICWRGANLTFDFANCAQYYFEPAYANDRNAFDGCNFTHSKGRDSLFNKLPHSLSPKLVTGNQWFTDITMNALPNITTGAQLLRGGDCTQTYGDYDCLAMIDTVVVDHDSRWFTTPIGAMTVTYTGNAATATIEKSASGFNRIFTLRVDGASIAAFTIAETFNAAIADTQFSPRHVVDWINTLPDWSATLLDDSRAASVLYPDNGGVIGGTFPAQDVNGVTLTLQAAYDVHGDIAQVYNAENVVLANNIVTDSDVQMVFFKDGFVRDALVINNAFDNKNGNNFSQFADIHSHVVTAHNSWSQQGFSFRTDFTGPSPARKYDPDAFCLFANNICPTLSWGNGGDADLTIANNHLMNGGGAPVGSTDTTIGGTGADLFADAANGDFTPIGGLLANLATPVVVLDRLGQSRRANGQGAAKGAISN